MMESFIIYMLKSAIWIAVFLLIYSLFLKKEIFFRFNRIFLFAGLGFSFVFALFQFHYAVEIPVFQTVSIQSIERIPEIEQIAETHVEPPFDWMRLLVGIYILGAVLLIVYHLFGLYRIRKMIRQGQAGNEKIRHKIIELQNIPSSFSFFGYVFLKAGLPEVEKRLVLEHESVHVTQRHCLDIAAAQTVCALQWFNPFAWLYVSAVKQNQEYIADRLVLEKGYSQAVYHAVLINSTLKTSVFTFANSFTNYKFKRIIMMKKNVLKPAKKWAVLLIAPALAVFMWAFAKPVYSYSVVPSPKTVNMTVEDSPGDSFSDVLKISADELVLTGLENERHGEKKKNDNPGITDTVFVNTITGAFGVTTNASASQKSKQYEWIINESAHIELDGKEISMAEFENLSADSRKSVEVMSSDRAVERYGEKGKNGMVIVSTKNENPQDEKIITGQVLDEDMKPVPGAAIVIDGTTKGTVTDMEGHFTLKVEEPEVSISIMAIGKEKSTVKVQTTGTVKSIILKHEGDSAVRIDTAKRSFLWEITGTMDGTPLIVIDGEISENADLGKINPHDLESLEVFKHKSATDRYGEKGKNGVILITTKKAKSF